MSNPRFRCVALAVLVALAGCAGAKVTETHPEAVQREKISKPEHIIVHNFSATAEGIPPDSPMAAKVVPPESPPSEAERELGRQLGAEVAKQLVEKINEMGLTAQVADQHMAPPHIGDLVLRGYFVSVDEGSMLKRVVIGFGSGSAELQTIVEGYLMTAAGLTRIGSGMVDTGGGKGPGMIVPIAVTVATANPIGLVVGGAVKAGTEIAGTNDTRGAAKHTAGAIADVLKQRFQEQGWIDK
jgi:hypothetical protein